MNNKIFKRLSTLITVLTGKKFSTIIFEAMKQAQTPVSKSRIQGWRVSEQHKNYRHMSSDEILDVINALIKYYE